MAGLHRPPGRGYPSPSCKFLARHPSSETMAEPFPSLLIKSYCLLLSVGFPYVEDPSPLFVGGKYCDAISVPSWLMVMPECSLILVVASCFCNAS
jgi:hypothetical protein